MAAGDLIFFEESKLYKENGTINLDADVFKCALITNAVVPTAADATPALGDYTEVTAGGSYTAGGITVTLAQSEAGGTVTLDITTNPSWTKLAGSPTNCYYALVYSDTATSPVDAALCAVDLGGPLDMTAGDITVTWHASGLYTF